MLSEGRYEKNFDKNEKIEIWEANGVEHGDDLKEILADFQHSATGTQCKKPLFHVQLRVADDESLSREQWLEGINRLEQRLELEGHERVIVTHNLNGLEHVHVVWNRIDHEQRKAADLHYYKHKCTDLAKAAIEKQQREEAEAREQQKELQEKQLAGHLGATLYNKADMVHMQRDAMRHLKDAHRKRQRGGDPGQMQPDEQQQEDRARLEKTQQEEKETKDVRRDFWEEMRALRRSASEEAREDKKDRTEQTEYQKAKARRDALREQTDALLGRPSRGDRGDEVDGHERERE